ncbi:hypothetical protein EHQ68_14390 [Leptospira congkakensis]|uniref:N-acetyltransferase domain-containing protein n=1 Tax=Leptospira congkakensis TaxID=2484932 RepID=A0A4Z1A9F1_9LEPT|nr:hypothetical protein [Leptospira congkakensis]TGL86501.1 hypothetical protein EHQ68_14390 [Leptospira congkakensis]TGL93953.1 hypothetical protein EHQ69_05640 [Leptospira congkakensis]TGL94641.1 hypothetical protein EHQ70_15155 [Leptospira congkakensis]
MRILFDTNILIHLEDNKVLKKDFSAFYSLAISNDCKIFYHPAVIEDIKKDKDANRKEIFLSKLSKYQPLPSPAIPDLDFLEFVGEKNANDAIDNKQLFQISAGYVELFITEDKEILKKGAKLGLTNKILNIQSGLRLLSELYNVVIPSHPILKEGSVREIIHLIDNAFFDSLREDYPPNFNDWFKKCAQEDRKAYFLMVEENLSAILIYNKETPVAHKLSGIFENALKICTLKVAEDAFGYKIGELFLSKMFALCIESNIRILYLTVFPKHSKLIELLRIFGFKEHQSLNGEFILLKFISKKEYNGLNIAEEHPFYSDHEKFSKFVVPIREIYATTLFKDSNHRHPGLFDNDFTESKSEIEGNTILKAYICNSKIKVSSGDILFFYVSKTMMEILPVGIVESFHVLLNLDEIIRLVSKRTVFSQKNLDQMFEEKGRLTIILFRLLYYLKKPIPYATLKELESAKSNLVNITKLSEDDYKILKQKEYFDERYLIN